MDALLQRIETLTPDQRTSITRQLENDKKTAKLEAVEAAKLEFRAGVAGSRKPDQYVFGKANIKTFMEMFEPFRAVMCLDGKPAINAFMTYIDSKAQNSLIESGATRKNAWIEFKADAVKALSPPQAGVQARFEIKRAKQRQDETVAEFGQRLLDLARVGYTETETAAKHSALKDALSGGVRRDELAVHLINMSDGTFSDMLAEAIKRDASFLAREALRENDKYAVAVMNTKMKGVGGTVTNVASNDRAVNQSVVCFKCYQPGHYAPQCPISCNNINGRVGAEFDGISQAQADPYSCWYCGKIGHLARNCYRIMQGSQASAGFQNFSGNFSENRVPYQHSLNRYDHQQEIQDSDTLSSGNWGRNPLEDRAYLAYNSALEGQRNRNIAVGSGHSSASTGDLAEARLGNERYNAQFAPSRLIESDRTRMVLQENQGTFQKN